MRTLDEDTIHSYVTALKKIFVIEVLHLGNGEYGLVEIKLGGETLINEGIVTLHKLNGLIKAKGMKEPKFMMVLTGTGSFAHEEDGVFVCPLSALKQ